MGKIWANSGDSHFLESATLWRDILPPAYAARMPRSERVGDHREIVHVDGQQIRRSVPKLFTKKSSDGMTIAELSGRAPGSRDVRLRMQDLDEEGVWAEVVFPSLGLWHSLIRDPELVKVAAQAQNEWALREVQGVAPDRLVATAMVPVRNVEDAVETLEVSAELGFKAVYLPTGVPAGVEDYHRDYWEPLWAAAEAAHIVLAFHIGTDGVADQAGVYSGPGGAVLNYVETTYGGQKVATKLVASGALDRHPDLKVLIAEGGASWVPFLGDRMNEGYRQHGMFVRPALSAPPKEILYRQVYTSFQHDESAPAAMWAQGYRNVLWGSDYPHLEGTWGHTQKTLHELFDDVTPEVRDRITREAFRELFPHTSEPPPNE